MKALLLCGDKNRFYIDHILVGLDKQEIIEQYKKLRQEYKWTDCFLLFEFNVNWLKSAIKSFELANKT